MFFELVLGLFGMGVKAHKNYKDGKHIMDIRNDACRRNGVDYHYDIDGNRRDNMTEYQFIDSYNFKDRWYQDSATGEIKDRKTHMYRFSANGAIMKDITFERYDKMISDAKETANRTGERYVMLNCPAVSHVLKNSNLLDGEFSYGKYGQINTFYYDSKLKTVCVCISGYYRDFKTGKFLSKSYLKGDKEAYYYKCNSIDPQHVEPSTGIGYDVNRLPITKENEAADIEYRNKVFAETRKGK